MAYIAAASRSELRSREKSKQTGKAVVMKRSSCFSRLCLEIIPIFLLTLGALPALSQVSVLTRSYDNQRTGTNLSETVLTQSNVNPSQFAKLFHPKLNYPLSPQIS